MWKQPDALVPVHCDREFIFLPGDSRLDFLRRRIGFTHLGKHVQDSAVHVTLVGGHQLRMDVLKRLEDVRLEEIDLREEGMIDPRKNMVGALPLGGDSAAHNISRRSQTAFSSSEFAP
jgi:hypothetical protein